MIDSIINGDSILELKKIPDNFVHAIISDIPYGICLDDWDVLHNNKNSALGGASSAQHQAGGIFKRRGKPLNGWSDADKKIPIEYQNWCSLWADSCFRILKPGGSCFIFAGRRYAHRCIVALEDCGFTFKDMLAWEKKNAPCRAQRISETFKRRGDEAAEKEWQGWRVANLRPLYEPILWFQKPYKTGGTLADNILAYGVGAWNEEALNIYNIHSKTNSDAPNTAQTNIIEVTVDRKSDYGLHEAQKPLRLMELLVSLVTTEGAVILDPFAGSGTTCLAAKRLGRHYIGIECDENYVKIATERLRDTESITSPDKKASAYYYSMSLFDEQRIDGAI